MKQKLCTIALTFLLTLLPGGMFTSITTAAAPTGCSANGAAGQVLEGIKQTNPTSNCSPSGVDNAVAAAVNILSLVVGIAAVIMIIISGFRYITSGGSSERVGSAKNTLIYAIIGLIIVALAQLIVHFVINKAGTIAG